MEGTVTSIRSVLCEVDAQGRTYVCQARRRLVASDTGESKPLAVGDRVAFSATSAAQGVIERMLPRRTKLSRRSPRDVRTEHVIVANVDHLLIVSSMRKPPLSLGIIDRYIIAGHAGGLEPLVCINKVDLAEDPSECSEAARIYQDMGYTVFLTSAQEQKGLEPLKEALRGKSTVLAGHSGVGKSSLLNAIQPGLRLRTGPVSTKGRHVTNWVSLLRLDAGGYVVDTPGIREFTLWDIQKTDVAQFFPQIWDLSPHCRMPNCLHTHEPDCAVKRAAEAGELPLARYESYLRIVETIEEQRVPRATDVETPETQVHRQSRAPSRRKARQDLRRRAREELGPQEPEEAESA